MVDLAAQVRLQCLLASVKLAVEFVFPLLQLTPTVVSQTYAALRENVLRLSALRTQNAIARLTMLSGKPAQTPHRRPAEIISA